MKSPLRSRLQWSAIAVLVLMAAVMFWPGQSSPASPPGPGAAPFPGAAAAAVPQLEVTVKRAVTGTYRGRVEAFGEARARYQLTLAAQVSGRVESLDDGFDTGRVVQAGEVLARIDRTDYAYELALAKGELAAAEQSLLEEQRQSDQAQLEWKRSGLDGEPDPLVLREPQLKLASARLEQAQKQQDRAARNLQFTELKAPFDALVVTRDIEPGSYVQVGSPVATLFATDRIEVRVPLSEAQWQTMGGVGKDESTGFDVTLNSLESDAHWDATYDRAEHHLSGETRQRAIVLVVDQPLEKSQPLYPGSFLRIDIAGRQYQGLWEVPETAITQSGELWYVDDADLLQRYTPEIIFSANANSYVRPPHELLSARIVQRPLATYLAGMKVRPLEPSAVERG